MMTEIEVQSELRRLVPEQVRFRLTSTQKQEVIGVYQQRPGSLAAICQKASTARSPYNYFVAAIARVVDEIAQQPQPRVARRPHDDVSCQSCADTGFVILLVDISEDAREGDAAPCHCPLGQQKQRRYGIVHYGADQYDWVIDSRPAVSLHLVDGDEAGDG